ncbi:ankyrin [Cryphonectria parasitica EP155]|uniref:Ankyrin n=1 Tax=Cryphonectria parasitica (strain ATCC 38755 / EP155) TaxID=660469 RepID=A0A9P4Y6E2_CRYP1|nr:ankyrin [Cryphonectria parasitica EP155]KAF3766950.1 ankyrin [Cryphonectria parasitica EP155]
MAGDVSELAAAEQGKSFFVMVPTDQGPACTFEESQYFYDLTTTIDYIVPKTSCLTFILKTIGTGKWFRDEPQYRNWEKSYNGLLWVNGIQFVQSMLSRRAALSSYAERRKQMMDVFTYTIAKVGAVVLLVDGLDEIPRDLQEDVVKSLKEVQQSSKKCRLLITSRPYTSIKELFQTDPPQAKFTLKAQTIDVDLYVRDRISRKGWDREKNKAELVHNIIKRLIRKLPDEAAKAYDRGLKRLAQEFASSKQKDGLPCQAIQALFWVAYAKSPMTEKQLRQALAIEEGDADYDPTREIWDETGIEALCGDLVVVDRRNGEVRVAHKTITEHLLLETTKRDWFPTIREHIPSRLLQFLQFDCLKRPLEDASKYMGRYPLCSYALDHWGSGLNAILKPGTSLWATTEDFLKKAHSQIWNDHVRDLAVKSLVSKAREHDEWDNWKVVRHVVTPGPITGLHWAVLFNLQAFVPILSEHERKRPITDPIPTTPLGLAGAFRRASREDMARKLLENGAEVNATRAAGRVVRPPLYNAVYYCSAEVVKILLEASADMTLRRDDNDKSPLDLAYVLGCLDIARLLVSHISGHAPTKAQEMQSLVRGGFADELQRAISEGLDVNHPCENGKMALDYARGLGDDTITGILVANQATWEESDCARLEYGNSPSSMLLLEVAVKKHVKLPIRSIVFETVSRDQGWSSFPSEQGTYIGSTTIHVSLKQPGEDSPSFVLQHNVNAHDMFKLHTNIWNLSELKASSPRRAELIENIRHGSVIQVSAHMYGAKV